MLPILRVVAIALIATACTSSNSSDSGKERINALKSRLESPSPTDVIVVAHRTCWRDTAENSLAGIERCVEVGVDMIEIDVRETADGELVLMHDETIDRTTSGTGPLSTLTFDDVKELTLKAAAGGDGAEMTDEHIPTLVEALSAAKDRLLVNLDIKETLYDRALALAEEVGSQDQIIIKMRAPADDSSLVDAAFHGRTYFMPIIRECTDDPLRECADNLAGAIPTYSKFTPIAIEVVNHTDDYLLEGIPVAQDMGVRVWVNTLGPRFAAGRSDDKSLTDPDANWGYLVENGVDMIQTDRPEELIEYLESRGNRRGQ